MSSPEFMLDDKAPTASWADPKSSDSASNSALAQECDQDQSKKLFEHHGKITKVVLPPAKSGQEDRIGFMHFAERASATKAHKNTEKYEIDGENSPPCFFQPMAYGRAVPNPGIAMVPIILPDGCLRYVLQQPGPPAAVHQRGGGRNASSGAGGRNSSSGGWVLGR